MHAPLVLLCLLPTLAAPQSGAPAATDGGALPVDQVEVRLRGLDQLSLLLQVARDVDDHRPVTEDGRVTLYADDAEQAYLRGLGFELEVVIENLTRHYAERAAADPGLRSAAGSMGGFRTLVEIEQEMDRLAASYPQIVSARQALGTSHEGRTIWSLRVSDNPAVYEPGEPTAWFDAIHHAREPMSGESLLLFIDWLGQRYGSDPMVTRLVDSRNFVFVPCVNPDGYEYNRQVAPNGGGMWRKNRRDNLDGSFGVDLNRNYDWEWGPQWGGSSSGTYSEIYRGPAPFSEPETQAMRDAAAMWPPRMSISTHSYSNLWLYPWGYTTIYTADDPAFFEYGTRMTANNYFPYGTIWEILYTANGNTIDYHYGTYGAFSFTPEIGSPGDGFWPIPGRIPALFHHVLPGYLMTARWSGAWAEVVDRQWVELSGDGDPWPEPGEEWELGLVVENQGMDPLNASFVATSADAAVTVLAGGGSASVPVRSQGTATPIRLRFESGAVAGRRYDLNIQWDYEGVVTTEPLAIRLGKVRVLSHDDMEVSDFGWQVSNPSRNWSWERGVPERTATGGENVQPPRDNPLGIGTQCWVTGAEAGSNAGSRDVDGVTVLTSPRIVAGGLEHLELEYARWFACVGGSAADDRLLIEVSSDDGQSWVTVESALHLNHWITVRCAFEDFVPLSDTMRLRFVASDQPNNDITEALVDDIVLRTVSDLPSLGLWGATGLGSTVKLALDGPAAAAYRVQWSFNRGAGTPVPGVAGLLYLSGAVQDLLSGSLDAAGEEERTVTVPNSAALSGRTVYLQALVDDGGPDAAYSNLLTVVLG